jgi:ADP-heptose:LPS heptosyltransferase
MGEVITWGELAPAEPPLWDVQLEVMELPYLLRVTADRLEPMSGYLQLPPAEVAAVREAMGPRRMPRIGVVWSAGSWNPSRSVPFQELAPLLAVEGVEFWSLQGQHKAEDYDGSRPELHRDVYECGDGILRLAAVIAELDLVITVDTLAAHLAGALGVRCWVMLQHRADWRWMTKRVDTPWYPSLRLFRQSRAGDWTGVLARVSQELTGWLESSGDATDASC